MQYTAREFYRLLKERLAQRGDVQIVSKILQYSKGDTYEFARIASLDIQPRDMVVLIRAGIHGDEISGPLSILENVSTVIECAHEQGVKVIIYPLGNPSGFEHGLRYNIDHDKGDAGNGDFMRYELADGTLVDDLGNTNDYRTWYWSSDPTLGISLPKETELMHEILKRDPLTQVKGVIDLHQDFITPDAPPSAYHYSFGDLSVYQPIVDRIASVVPILKETAIGAGFHVALDASGVALPPKEEELIKSDGNGFIVRHDGSLPDLMYRLGAPYCVTAETMGATKLADAIEVNMLWMKGIIDLVASLKQA